MAKFSTQFLQGLLQPSYQQGMLTAAQQLGALPRKREESRMLSNLDLGTPEGLSSLSNYFKSQGKLPEALQASQASRTLATENAALSNLNMLRDNIIKRAGDIPGLEQIAEAAQFATAPQLESMRQTIIAAEQEAQEKTDLSKAAQSAAENIGFDADFIQVFADDPEGLVEVVRSVGESKAATALERADERTRNKTLAARARSYNAPTEIITDIQEGFYTDEPLKALAAMRGEDSKNESYQDSTTGEVFLLPTKGAKVFKDNKWSFPSEIGLIEAPKVTAEGSVPKFRAEQRNVPFLSFAAGATDRFVNELDTFSDLQTNILTAGVSPFSTDATEALDGYRAYVSESLLRFFSGAAVPEAEQQRYKKMVTITLQDIFSPKAVAQKVIAASALTSINAKLSAGEISAVDARAEALEAGALALSDEDYDLIRVGKKGSLKKVIKKYTDPLLKDSGSAQQGPADSILSKYNL